MESDILTGKVKLIGVKLNNFKEWFFDKNDKRDLQKTNVFLSLDQKGADSTIYGPFNIPLESEEIIFKYTPDGKMKRLPSVSLRSMNRLVNKPMVINIKHKDNYMVITIGSRYGTVLS